MAHSLDLSRADLGTKMQTCEEHGEYLSAGKKIARIEFWTKCPDCEERRKVNELKAEAQRKAEAERKAIERTMRAACLPARFVGRSFENFKASSNEQGHALKVVREYAENFPDNYAQGLGLVLAGEPGTGKSHLATAAMQVIMDRYGVLYVTCMGMIRAIRSTWAKNSEKTETDVLNTLCRVDLLVIDEIGVQYGTDGEMTLLFEVLDRRYRDMMPTILLTNQDKNGLKQFIGERAYDRLTETSKWVPFDWDSYRTTARTEMREPATFVIQPFESRIHQSEQDSMMDRAI